MKKLLSILLSLLILLLPMLACAQEHSAREDMIDDILAAAKKLYDNAGGKLQKAHYAGDKYLCKNFTVYVFKQAAGKYRMAEFPDKELVIPNNLPKKECKPYHYGIEWESIDAKDGNPFEIGAQFKYDKALSKKENIQKATDFMKQVQKGDYFQMSAKYYYGVGAHSLIFIADYDAENNTVHWTDSNMKGQSKGGIRYGLPQWDAQKKIDWFVDAFCRPGRGATLYRLRQDIIAK